MMSAALEATTRHSNHPQSAQKIAAVHRYEAALQTIRYRGQHSTWVQEALVHLVGLLMQRAVTELISVATLLHRTMPDEQNHCR